METWTEESEEQKYRIQFNKSKHFSTGIPAKYLSQNDHHLEESLF